MNKKIAPDISARFLRLNISRGRAFRREIRTPDAPELEFRPRFMQTNTLPDNKQAYTGWVSDFLDIVTINFNFERTRKHRAGFTGDS